MKLMKHTFALLLIFILLGSCVFAESGSTGEKIYKGEPKKDPVLASSISWYIPGGGQFYSGNYKKGLFFLGMETGLFITTLGLVTNYSYDLGNGFLIDPKENVTKEDKQLAWGLGTLLLALHIYNIVDAYKTANDFNLKLDKDISQNHLNYIYYDRKDPFVAGILSWKMPGLGQIYTKNYYQGSKFMLGSIVLKIWGIYIYQDLEEKYGKSTLGISWNQLSENDKNLILTYGIFYLSFEVLNIYDAVNSAEEYNRKQENFLKAEFEQGVSIDEKTGKLKLVYAWKF